MWTEHEMRQEDMKRLAEARSFRDVSRRIKKSVVNTRLDRPDLMLDLVGRRFLSDYRDCINYKPIEVTIEEIYPHMVKTRYFNKFKDQKTGEVHESGPFYACFSTADLVTKGIITFDTGRAEVVR